MTGLEAHIEVDAPRAVDRRIERLDDGRAVIVPAVVHARPIEPSDSFPPMEIVVDALDGALVVTKVTLTGSRERPIDADAIRGWSLPRITQLAVRALTLKVTSDGGYEFDETSQAAEIITRAIRKRTTVSSDRLQEVADLYANGGIGAVMDVLFVSRSQAYRLVAQARKSGSIRKAGQ